MKVAICGVWHVHAPQYTEAAMKYAEVIGAYDRDPEKLEAFSKKMNVPTFSDFDALLHSDADSVIVCSATECHTEDIIRLAECGKNIFTEKVLALTKEDCEAIREAIERTGVRFVISLPQKTFSAPRTVKSIVDAGKLGKINYVRFRNCHTGSSANWLPEHFYNLKECGGGAMIDLGAHGMYLIDWLLGLPDSYSSTFRISCDKQEVKAKNRDNVEDNAVTVMGYSSGAIAVNETGFVSGFYPQILEVGGEFGCVRMVGSDVFLSLSQETKNGVSVKKEEAIPEPIVQFLTDDIRCGFGIDEACRLTEMMVGAYKNAN